MIIPSAIGYHELQMQNMIKHYGGGVLRLVYKYILVIEPAWGEKIILFLQKTIKIDL